MSSKSGLVGKVDTASVMDFVEFSGLCRVKVAFDPASISSLVTLSSKSGLVGKADPASIRLICQYSGQSLQSRVFPKWERR